LSHPLIRHSLVGFRILRYPSWLDYDECFAKRAIRWGRQLEEKTWMGTSEVRRFSPAGNARASYAYIYYIRILEPRCLDDATMVRIKQLDRNDAAPKSPTRKNSAGTIGVRSTERRFLSEAKMRAIFVMRVDNATPIILNREKSITLGILGTLTPWRSTKLSPGMGELCADATSMRTQEFGSWRSRNGCSIRWPAAVCAWRRCPRSTAVHCWI
jgi:hypothetical protein